MLEEKIAEYNGLLGGPMYLCTPGLHLRCFDAQSSPSSGAELKGFLMLDIAACRDTTSFDFLYDPVLSRETVKLPSLSTTFMTTVAI